MENQFWQKFSSRKNNDRHQDYMPLQYIKLNQIRGQWIKIILIACSKQNQNLNFKKFAKSLPWNRIIIRWFYIFSNDFSSFTKKLKIHEKVASNLIFFSIEVYKNLSSFLMDVNFSFENKVLREKIEYNFSCLKFKILRSIMNTQLFENLSTLLRKVSVEVIKEEIVLPVLM